MRGILLVAVLALSGCATEAQREMRRFNEQVTRTAAALKPCFDTALQSPAALALKDKLPPWDLRDPIPLTTLADNTKATPEQVRHLFDYYAGLQPCRKMAMEQFAAIHPGLVALLAEAYAGQDERAVQLAKGAVTWGESARAANQARQATMAQLHALDQQITQTLANATPMRCSVASRLGRPC